MAQGSDERWQGQGFPYISTPLVDAKGQITRPWLQLLIGLWTHTAGANDALLAGVAFGNLEDEGQGQGSSGGGGGITDALMVDSPSDDYLEEIHNLATLAALGMDPQGDTATASDVGCCLLPLVNGDLPGPTLMSDPFGQTIGVPIR